MADGGLFHAAAFRELCDGLWTLEKIKQKFDSSRIAEGAKEELVGRCKHDMTNISYDIFIMQGEESEKYYCNIASMAVWKVANGTAPEMKRF